MTCSRSHSLPWSALSSTLWLFFELLGSLGVHLVAELRVPVSHREAPSTPLLLVQTHLHGLPFSYLMFTSISFKKRTF